MVLTGGCAAGASTTVCGGACGRGVDDGVAQRVARASTMAWLGGAAAGAVAEHAVAARVVAERWRRAR
jgi:hypothetical protein